MRSSLIVLIAGASAAMAQNLPPCAVSTLAPEAIAAIDRLPTLLTRLAANVRKKYAVHRRQRLPLPVG